MLVRLFITSKQQLTITVEKSRNGSYTAYEARSEDRKVQILNSWSLDWLIDTLHMRYMGETLIQEV